MGDFVVNVETRETCMLVSRGGISCAEELCLHLCKLLKVAPIAAPLFALQSPETKLFLKPNATLDDDHKKIDFRIRFKVPTLKRLKNLDLQAYNYYFYQVRNDVLNNRVAEIVYTKHRDQLMGLGVTDMQRVMLEEGKTREELEKDYKKYIPREVTKKHSIFAKKPIHDTLAKLKYIKLDAGYVKDKYLEQLNCMAPNYLFEKYDVKIDIHSSVNRVSLQIMPYHQEQPGLRIHYENKNEWDHLCTIDDLCFMSARVEDNTVEISRKNGIPIYLQFPSTLHMNSFISACDGYYRLMIKWTFNLCKHIPSPSLQKLHEMKCHGPVGLFFSYHKLAGNKPGCFIIRQCEQNYDTYYLDICSKNSPKPETYKIEMSENRYILHDNVKVHFDSIFQLIASYKDPNGAIYLQRCLPPSEYDKSQLLICEDVGARGSAGSRVQPDDLETLLVATREPRCINTKQLLLYKRSCVEGSERLSVLYRAVWNIAHDKNLEVVMKILKDHHSDKYMKDFIDNAGQWAHLHSTAIVRLYGITLRSPVSMIMEFLPLGPLDVYLRNNKKRMQRVDLVEVASALATALFHLAENKVVHGNMRCRKLLVAEHSNTHFTVKLSDPGLHSSYLPHDIHWLPVEYFNNMEIARTAIHADVWAFATTLWEVFSYGTSPAEINPTLTMKSYLGGHRLLLPSGCPQGVFDIISSCWHPDPHQRMRPQAIMRDVNHLLYQVFNSRRTHSYATVDQNYYKDSSMGNGSTLNLLPNSAGINDYDSSFLSACDIDRMSLVSPSFSGGLTTMTDDFDSDSNTITYDSLSKIKPKCSIDSVDAIQTIFDLDDSSIVLQGLIGEGFYGEVYKGTMECNIDAVTRSDSEPREVAIKKLKTSSMDSQRRDFEREISIMKRLKHPNIVEILGVVEEPAMLVMEYLRHGSLKGYLKTNRHSITHRQLLVYALDVAMGMEYLDKMHVVHRDLAARNILVVDESHVKISDFGLAQLMNEENCYMLKTDRDLPIKWYAPESVSDGKFSSQSDVWSFGITLWEMFSFGEEPPTWEMNNLKDRLAKLIQPKKCPSEVYVNLLMECWQLDPIKRPNFSSLTFIIRDLIPHY